MPTANKNYPKYMRGFSSLSLLLLVCLLVAGGLFAVKTLPYYRDHHLLENAIEEVAKTDKIEHYRRAQILEELNKAVDRHARAGSKLPKMTEIAYLNNDNGERFLGVDYEVRVPIIVNMSILLKFSSVQSLGKVTAQNN